MLCSTKSPAVRRFARSCWMSAGLVVVLAVVAALAFRLGHLKGLLAYPVAVLPSVPILWVLFETGRYLAVEKDEFQRNLACAVPAGRHRRDSGDDYRLGLSGGVRARTAPATMWIYPIFWLFVGLSVPVVMLRYK